MTQKHAIQIQWDGRNQRYVARHARFPALLAYGPTRYEAEEAMRAKIGEHLKGETPKHERTA